MNAQQLGKIGLVCMAIFLIVSSLSGIPVSMGLIMAEQVTEVRAQEPPEFKLVLPATELLSALPRIDRQIVGALGVDSIRALFGGDMGQSPNLRPFTSLLRAGDVEGSYLVDMEDVEVTTLFLGLSEVQGALPRDVSLHWEAGLVDFGPRTYRRLYVTAKDALATGEMPEDFATQHVGNLIAVVIDGEVVRTLLIGCPESYRAIGC